MNADYSTRNIPQTAALGTGHAPARGEVAAGAFPPAATSLPQAAHQHAEPIAAEINAQLDRLRPRLLALRAIAERGQLQRSGRRELERVKQRIAELRIRLELATVHGITCPRCGAKGEVTGMRPGEVVPCPARCGVGLQLRPRDPKAEG